MSHMENAMIKTAEMQMQILQNENYIARLEAMSMEQINEEFTKVNKEFDHEMTLTIVMESGNALTKYDSGYDNNYDGVESSKFVKMIRKIITNFITIVKKIGKIFLVSITKLKRLIRISEKKCASMLKISQNQNSWDLKNAGEATKLKYKLNDEYVESARSFVKHLHDSEDAITSTIGYLKKSIGNNTLGFVGTMAGVGGKINMDPSQSNIHKAKIKDVISHGSKIKNTDPIISCDDESNILTFANDIANKLVSVRLEKQQKLLSKFELNILEALSKCNNGLMKGMTGFNKETSKIIDIDTDYLKQSMQALYLLKDMYGKIIDGGINKILTQLDSCVGIIEKCFKDECNVLPHLKAIARAYVILK